MGGGSVKAGPGRLRLEPGDACHPRGVYSLLEPLSRSQLENLLIDVAVYHREAFEEALLNERPLPKPPAVRYGPI